MKIGFLFNHYLIYQVLHGAPFAFELSRTRSDFQVELLFSNQDSYNEAKRIAVLYPDNRCTFNLLKQNRFTRFVSSIIPDLHRPIMLLTNRKLLASFNALLAPEKNYILLKALPSFRDIRFIGLRHGAGDRDAGSLNKGSLKFDYLMVSGQTDFERFKDELPEGCCKVVGYPKFEVLEKLNPETLRLFNNDRPVILYSPHFHRQQSSWKTLGSDVLSFFAESDVYNLVFAPHARLFKDSIYHDNIDIDKFRNCPNILIDTGSEKSVDMTYTRAADIYLGDVSSQVYEFIYHQRRPCVFLNPNKLDATKMSFWRFGPVIEQLDSIQYAISNAEQDFEKIYLAEQDKYLRLAISLETNPPSKRGAKAIIQFLDD
jgi:hypothetical protein